MRIITTLHKLPLIWLCGAGAFLAMGTLARRQLSDGAISFDTHDIYYIEAYNLALVTPIALFVFFATLYWVIGRLSHQRFPTWAGQLHFWMMLVGLSLSFFAPIFLPLMGIPRRYTESAPFETLVFLTNIGAWLTVASLAFFICFTTYYFITKRRAKT